MVSEARDNIKYLSVDDMHRRRYWLTGEPREDVWQRISRPKLSLMAGALTKAGVWNFFIREWLHDYFLLHDYLFTLTDLFMRKFYKNY